MMGSFGSIRANQQIHQEAGVSGMVANSTSAASANTVALQTAIDAAIKVQAGSSFAKLGAKLYVPGGTYYINDTIAMRNVMGLQLIGDGGQTVFVWTGNDNAKPVFLMSHCYQCSIMDMIINVNTAAYAAIQCRRDNHVDATIAPMRNAFEKVFVDGNGTAVYGIVLGGAGSVDANNDFNDFKGVSVSGYTKTGFLLTGSQSYNNMFENCRAVSYQGADYGVETGNVGGSFVWDGGFLGAHAIADFSIGRSGFPSVARNFNSEGSNAILEIIPEMYNHITLENFRWAGNGKLDGGPVIIASEVARHIQLRITNGRIGSSADSGNGCPAYTIPINLQAAGSFTFEDCTLYTSAADPFPLSKPTNNPTYAGNVKITNEGTMTREALTWQ